MQQIRVALDSVSQHIQQLPLDCVPVFTDGSALSNPGPCGSSAIVYTSGMKHQPVTLKKPVSKCSTSFHAEVAAIQLGLDFVVRHSLTTPKKIGSVMVYTDCQAALNTVVNGCSTYSNRIQAIDESTRALKDKDIAVTLCWVPGHAGLPRNRAALVPSLGD